MTIQQIQIPTRRFGHALAPCQVLAPLAHRFAHCILRFLLWTVPDTSFNLDCPSLSRTTLNLIRACLPPSPSFDSPLLDLTHTFAPFGIPFSSSISQLGISTPHFPSLVVCTIPNPSCPLHGFPFPRVVSARLSQTLKALHHPCRRFTKASGDPSRTTWRHLDPTRSRKGGA